jgi:photosystem II stability/assembly factor-like uncharacterized protein
MDYRLVGPHRGGRSTAVTGIGDRPFTFFMGTTGGGVWKTEDAGETWINITDGFLAVSSIGAVEVAESDPNVIYVGTGSAGIRGNVSTGRGVYKSKDGGRSWDFIGLRETGLIGRIAADPRDPDVVFVAALGHPFGKNEERGVFRSRDGGDSWDRVLFLSDSVGAVDLSMNPHNPREIYAGMWRAERKPWTLYDAAAEGGVYKTTDGGDTWSKLSDGLPQGLTGRIGVTVSPANPDRVWAQVNAHDPEGGIYRSDDAGATWQRVNRNRKLRQRHWYYSHIYADPQDENTVYAMNTSFYRSIDAGRTFQRISVQHGDVHDLWVNPNDPNLMVLANDGGAQVSLTGGASWSTMHNQPTAEMYRVSVDNQFPYRLYGGQQDNSTISVSSWTSGGLTPTEDWFSVGGCESGHVAVHATDPDIVYAGCYIGEITRVNLGIGDYRNVMLYPVLVDGVAPMDLTYRFQWNAPIVFSPHDPDVLYHTSNHVHRTNDGGMTWETISPDLTRNDKDKQDFPGEPLQHDHTSVEVYGTIFAFVESPHTPGTLWSGSDDGLVHVSRDNGGSWSDVTPTDLPVDGTVNTLEISPHQAGRVLLAVQRYRMDDYTPYVYLTNDYGESWELLTDGENGIPADFPVRVVREDPDQRGLLYAGTEFGMFVSFDEGDHWQSFQQNLPVTPITDLKVYRQDLVVATQGRSYWILDDLTPLHQLTETVADASMFLFDPRDPHLVRRGGRGGGSRSPESPPTGTVIQYYFADSLESEVTLDIVDAGGDVIRSFSNDPTKHRGEPTLAASAGMNRFVWDFRHKGLVRPEGAVVYLGYSGGATAVPGDYQVRLTVGDWSQTQQFELLKDPRNQDVTDADLAEQFELSVRVRSRLAEAYDAMNTIRTVREQVVSVAEIAQEAGYGEELGQVGDSISDKLTAVETVLINTKIESNQDPINFPPLLDNQLGYLYRYVVSAYGKPTQAAYGRLEELEGQLAAQVAVLSQVLDEDLARFNQMLSDAGAPGIVVPGARGAANRFP